MSMYWVDGVELINKAFEKKAENREWQMWLSIYPNMDQKSFISFSKFREKNKERAKASENKLSKDEILEKAENIRKIHKGEHKGIRKE